ncbi:MAG: hypothetical protein ACLP6G_16610 [Terriglobales bacterium]
MKRNARWTVWGAVLLLVCVTAGWSQQSASAAENPATRTASQLPRLVRFGGTLKDGNGIPLTGVVGVTFGLYSEQSGGASLWLETQNVQPDENGHYTVMLGATKLDGVPVELFASEQAQWLGVQPQGQAEQPRVMLVNVPYALKAVDAETLGGKPASAYALATPQTETSAPASESPKANAAISAFNNNQSSISAAITGGGTVNFLPRWTSSSALGNSNIFQNATNKDIGIGTTTPTATLDVKGTTLLNGGSTSAFGLTVSSSAQLGEEIQGPVTGVGAGLDFKTTGTGGKQWEILATGKTSSQGVGKLNIRDVNTSTDVLTIDTTDTVNIGNLAVSGFTSTGELLASVGIFGTPGMTSYGPVGIGPQFNKKLAAANLDVQGNGLDTLIGDPGCGANSSGIGFQSSGLNCGNFSIMGDGSDTYVAAPTGNIYFLTNSSTSTPMTIAAAGNVGVNNPNPQAQLDVGGSGTSGFGIATNSNTAQARAMGGWVKAMAYVDFDASNNLVIMSCYNSQATGSTINTPPCGFALLAFVSPGVITVDFGFQVSDRFISATPLSYQKGTYAVTLNLCPATPRCGARFLTPSQVNVATYITEDAVNGVPLGFYIFVF